MKNIEQIERLKKSIFTDEELKKLLKRITNRLLNSHIKTETISPLVLTHKELIDVLLVRIVKPLKDEVFEQIRKKGVFSNDFDKVVVLILKEDMQGDKIIHKTIAKYILNIIKENHLKLNYFASTMFRNVYKNKNGSYKYPEFFPFDKAKYSSAIPEIKQLLVKGKGVDKYINSQQNLINELEQTLKEDKESLKNLTLIKGQIVDSIAKKLKGKQLYKDKIFMLKNEVKTADLQIYELTEKVSKLEIELKTLKKSLETFKRKNEDLIDIENKLIEKLANNLMKPKVKIT